MILNAEMKPAKVEGKVLSSGFSIGNADVILTYLTKTIYSNPIRAICQEIMSNARDAHREAGNAQSFIVRVPNTFNPNWECQDFGPGITPDRMVKVFTQYGNSTKRGDNLQTGGFGIGGKTPFSYSDTFTIRTISDEDGKNVLRLYAAIKEGDTSPRLMEIGDPQETQEHTGTTISIPVKPDDFRNFALHSFKVTQFWDARPEIHGTNDHTNWEDFKWSYEGSNWKIGEGKGYYAEVYACVDGIPYALKREEFHGIDRNLMNILEHNTVMFFGVGVLTLSLNREQLQYDDRTKNAIIARLKEIQDWLETEVEKSIQGAKNLWEANILYNKLNAVFRVSNIANNVLWNNIKVDGNPISACSNYVNAKLFGLRFGRLRSEKVYEIKPNDSTIYVLDDDNGYRTNYRKIQTLRDIHGDKRIISITLPTYDATVLEKWEKDNHWEHIKDSFIKLSTIVPKAIVRAPRGSCPKTDDTFEYDDTKGGFVPTQIDRKNGEGVYFTCFRNRSEVQGSDVQAWLKAGMFENTQIFKIHQKHLPKLGKGWIHYKDALKKEFEDYVATVPHVLTSLTSIVNEDGSFLSEMSTNIKYFFDKNISNLKAGKYVDWYLKSLEVRNQPDPFNTPEAIKLRAMAQIAGVNLDIRKGTATLASMRDSISDISKSVLDDIVPHSWDYPTDAKHLSLLLDIVNLILEKENA